MAFNNTNLTQDVWKNSGGDQIISDYYSFLESENVPLTHNNVYLSTSNDNSTKYTDSGVADEVGSAAGTGLGAVFGGPIGAMIGSALGNVVGTGVNYLTSEAHADKQFKRQLDLQDRAFQLNQAAQRYQAQNEKHSLERAGMNPSQASANGAPTIQPGAAGLASSQMANIFDGLTELIVAAKAPSEISKIKAEEGKIGAETGKVESETDKIILADIPNVQQNTEKLIQDTRNAKNINDLFDAHQKFIKEQSPAIFDGYRSVIQATGQWEKLSPLTRSTINKLANGSLDIGIGELQGLNETIDAQSKLSQRDKDVLRNVLDSVVIQRQLKDDKVMTALAKLPNDARNKMYADMAYLTHANQNLDADTALKSINEWTAKYGNDQWLIENGMVDEVERKKTIDIINGFGEMMKNLVPFTAGGAAAGKVANTSASKGATIPKELQSLQKKHKGVFGEYFDRGPDGNFHPRNSKNWE